MSDTVAKLILRLSDSLSELSIRNRILSGRMAEFTEIAKNDPRNPKIDEIRGLIHADVDMILDLQIEQAKIMTEHKALSQ